MGGKGDIHARAVAIAVQARKIDDANQPTGAWFNLTATGSAPTDPAARRGRYIDAHPVISGASQDPLYQTMEFTVPAGRYEVRVARTSAVSDSTQAMDDLHWVGLRSFMAQVGQYENVTMLAVKIRATNNINNNIARRISVDGTRILPVWNGSAWTEQPTRSIAWAAADVFRNTIYGRAIPDKYINLPELLRLDAVWSGRGDWCDAHITENMTTWDAATQVLSCGRTLPIYYAGVVDFCRNEPRPQSAMFTPQNMLAESFNVRFAFPKSDEPDYVIVEYTDPVSWTLKEVDCALPDSQKRRGQRVQMPWITSRAQAWREGIHKAAMHRYQRQFPSFSTEMEGMIPRFGDRLLLSHDVMDQSATGVVVDFADGILTTNEPLPWGNGEHGISLRSRDGGVQGPFPITKIDDYSGRITGNPEVTDGVSMEPTHYVFGGMSRVGVDCVMLSAEHDGSGFSLAAVNYTDIPHTIENSMPVPPEGDTSGTAAEVLAIAWVKIESTREMNVFALSASKGRGVVRYEWELSEDGGATWGTLASGPTPNAVTALPLDAPIRIRVRAVGTIPGDWYYWSGVANDQEVAVDYIAPVMTVAEAGGDVNDASKTFTVSVTATALPEVVGYSLEQNGVVIAGWVLDPGQIAETVRVFPRQPDPDNPGKYRDSGSVTFRAYGYDIDRRKTAVAEQTFIY